MGDILHALPAVTALRAELPDSWIAWAVEPQWSALLQASTDAELLERGPQMPVVDALHRVPAKKWARSPLRAAIGGEIATVRLALRAMQYDVCIDLQGAVRSAWIGRMAGAPRMIGESAPRERMARWFFSERIATRGKHVVEQAREVCEAVLHRPLPLLSAALPHDAAAEQRCEQWLMERGIRRFVLMNPGAGWGAKCWPAERYGQVAQSLGRMGYATVVNVGPGEEVLARQVCALSGAAAFAMLGSVGELIACTRRADLVLGGDTGPLHLAAALQRPVVGIYGPTDPARNGPFESRAIVLRHPKSRRDHTRHSTPEAGLLTIQTHDVMDAIQQILSDKEGSA